MTKRDDLMRMFGPKLIEAMGLMVIDELNILRSKHGLSPRTPSQLYDQITNHLSDLPDYDWMQEE